jgi:HlyD family secretion protein
MKNKRRNRIILIGLVVLAGAAAIAWYYMNASATAAGELTASGTIEANSVRLSPQVSGLVKELLVAEGDSVKAGQVLAKIDDSTAQTQYAQTQAALQSAQDSLRLAKSNYALAAANASDEKRQAVLAGVQLEVTGAQQALQTLNDRADLAHAQAEQAVAAADKARDQAQDRLNNLLGASDPEDIQRAKANVVIAQDALKKAHEDYDRVYKYYKRTSNNNVSKAYLQIKLANAQDAYDRAVTRLNNLLGNANQIDVTLAESNLALAEASLANARSNLDKVKDGPNPDDLALAQARLAAAQANLLAAQQDTRGNQLQVAQDQVDVAQSQVANLTAQLQNISLQLDKYTISAPTDGVVLSRGVEVGETAGPGSVMFEIGPLQKLQLTIYLPEEQFGRVKPGDQARVTMDAYPGRTFTARVDRLADQAEFTPRNVQTAEGRRNTVFAVYLSLENPDLALMPGMWADVNFTK